jgi:hypothetical protein
LNNQFDGQHGVQQRNWAFQPIKLSVVFVVIRLSPGEDGKFSTPQIFDAMNSLSALEVEANRARFQAKFTRQNINGFASRNQATRWRAESR